jgi:hypothetical protein
LIGCQVERLIGRIAEQIAEELPHEHGKLIRPMRASSEHSQMTATGT